MSKYRTTPVDSPRMPGGIPYIIGNELAERFSFYGMKSILVVYMTKHLVDQAGEAAHMSEVHAREIYHYFTAAAYFFPIVGAIISDLLWGKYRTIIILSLGYCVGHASIALGDTRAFMDPVMWLFAGLAFIAVGAGGIKPCVSAHVGDQFGQRNKHLITPIFHWFYFSINVGAAASTLLTPILLRDYGPWAAFGLPGVLMALATFIFWLGRNKFVHVPPGGRKFLRETFDRDGLRAMLNLSPIFLVFIPMFWALFDQTGSAWVLQADKMDRHFLGLHWLPSQIQAVNPLLILILIPTFTYAVYPLANKLVRLTPLRRISIGFFVTAIAFGVSALIEEQITGGEVTDVRSISTAEGWSKQAVIDGPADGFGWASSRALAGEFPQDLTIRLRERRGWTIDRVEINPYTVVGPPDESDAGREEDARRDALPEGEREALEGGDDRESWAREVAVLVRNGEDGDGVDAFREVARLELRQENRLQAVQFPPVRATHVRVQVLSNWGGPQVKVGRVRVLATEAAPPADSPPNAAEAWPDVAAIGFQPNVGWQFLAYILLTAAEIMVSITSLEFAYTQAPKKMKSFIMGIYFLGISLGNAFTALVNRFIANEDGTTKLDGASYYWFFTALMAVTAVLFVFLAMTYRGRTYIQGEDELDVEARESQAEAEGIER